MLGTRPRRSVAVPVATLALLAVVLTLSGSAAAHYPGPGTCDAASTDVPVPPEPVPHPPITIDGDDPGLRPTVGQDPLLDQPLYRPGSGIVDGAGTAEAPYLIQGWTVPKVTIQDTDAHILVRNIHVTAPDNPRRLDQETGTVDLQDAPNITLRHVEAESVLAQASPDLCVTGLTTTAPGPTDPAPGGVVATQSPHAYLRDANVTEIELVGSPHATLHNNSLDETVDLRPPSPLVPLQPRHMDHRIPPNNTAAGTPVPYLRDAHDVTLTEATPNLLVTNSTNVTARNVDLTIPARLGWSQDITLENATIDVDIALKAHALDGFNLANTTIDGFATFEDSHRLHLLDNAVTKYISIEGGTDHLLEANLVRNTGGDRGIEAVDVGQITLRGNHIHRAPAGEPGMGIFVAAESAHVAANTVHNVDRFAGDAIHVAVTENATVRQNLVQQAPDGNGEVEAGLSVHTEAEDGGRLRVVNNTVNMTGSDDAALFVGYEPGWNATVRHNEATGGGGGISLWIGRQTNETDPVAPARKHDAQIHENEIWDNAGPGLDARIELDGVEANATRNWWGCPDGPTADACDGVDGNVTYTPWEEDPIPLAGADIAMPSHDDV